MPTVPYVTAAEFRAHPTYLDTNNLRTGRSQTEQDAALTNALLAASVWADDVVDMPLGAHTRVENARVSPDRSGRLRYHPEHAPVRAVVAMATGPTPASLATVADPQVWTEQDGRILVAYSPGAPGLASLQLGAPAPGGELLVQWTYIAGYPATQLAADAAAAATTVTVLDATGITPGTVLRLWTPGLEAAVTVASVAGTTVTLTGPLAADHPAGMSFTALPPTARQAVINYAAASLMRPAPAKEDNFPATGAGAMGSPSSGSRGGTGAGLVAEARRLLGNFARVR